MGIQIAPSILASDFANLATETERVGNADWLHVDVMDNHFVPNLTLGLPVVESLARATTVPMDCHLMIEDPDRWAPAYVEAGAGSVTFHVEAATAPVRLARELRSAGVRAGGGVGPAPARVGLARELRWAGARAGMGLRPATAIEPYEDLLTELDMVLVMTVEPG